MRRPRPGTGPLGSSVGGMPAAVEGERRRRKEEEEEEMRRRKRKKCQRKKADMPQEMTHP